ncbi:MAG: PmoA family protein [Sedimentisphaerales bacterium]|nr:PmoA family protein [Sedimentisphaerales bacterium]
MTNSGLILMVLLLSVCSYIFASSPRHLLVQVEDEVPAGLPVSIEVEAGMETNTPLSLYRLAENEKIPLKCQMEPGSPKRLWFIPDKTLKAGESLSLELAAAEVLPEPNVTAIRDEKAITLRCGDADILRYYHAVHDVPEGVDPLYRRSGFIHPLWSPNGMVLTEIQPKDHYHHYGIWGPWTKTKVQGQEIDFWNLGKGQGAVRCSEILDTISGPVFAGFSVIQEHIVLKPEEKVAIREHYTVRAFPIQLAGGTAWLIDITGIQRNQLDTPIELPAYRYGGGLGFRATPAWHKGTCSILTSEGKTRQDADGGRARWCRVQGVGKTSGSTCGLVLMSHPDNHQQPQPLRVWPEPKGDKDDGIFINFCPTRLESWALEPGRDVVLRYRLLVYDGEFSPETIETVWRNYIQSLLPITTETYNR